MAAQRFFNLLLVLRGALATTWQSQKMQSHNNQAQNPADGFHRDIDSCLEVMAHITPLTEIKKPPSPFAPCQPPRAPWYC
jgi:hypothetical protein